MNKAALVLLLLLGAAACSRSAAPASASPDAVAAPDIASAPDVALPLYPSNCNGCHDSTWLAAQQPQATGTQVQWLMAKGRGLVRVEPVFPTPGTVYGLPWPARGWHDAAALQNCAVCHPYRPEDGLGHSLLGYPDVAAVFQPGGTCTGCHGWLDPSMQPETLLKGADNGHARIWLLGVRPKVPQDYRFAAFNPGCGGCHNVASENHGAIAGCLDCHRMGGPGSASHDKHTKLIADNQAKLDPQAVTAGTPTCGWCHTPDSGETGRSRAACYNCHLSGHQPMDAKGKAQFWVVP